MSPKAALESGAGRRNFVFALLGRKSQKDKVMEEQGLRSGAVSSSTVPAVIFTRWRQVLSRMPLPDAVRGGYALAIGCRLDFRAGLRPVSSRRAMPLERASGA